VPAGAFFAPLLPLLRPLLLHFCSAMRLPFICAASHSLKPPENTHKTLPKQNDSLLRTDAPLRRTAPELAAACLAAAADALGPGSLGAAEAAGVRSHGEWVEAFGLSPPRVLSAAAALSALLLPPAAEVQPLSDAPP